MSSGAYRYVDDDVAFAAVLDELDTVDAYALDTEFHRERTYFPKIALLQLAWPGGLALVDPLRVDLAPLARILDGPAVAVLHAASQDLEVLLRSCGTVPATVFDTQIAAGFVGMSTPSLGALVERELGVHLPKADRLTDWLRRPLSADQCDYAASDVAHLLEIHERLVADLDRRGRTAWAEAECADLRARARLHRDPDEAWTRIKEGKHLRGPSRGVLRAVSAWRERRAIEVDQPARFVLPDLAVVAIAQRRPRTAEDLRSIRGVDDRHARGEAVEALLAAVRDGAESTEPARSGPAVPELARELRPAVGLVSAWVSQLARDEDLDAGLLATRSDIEALLRGDPDARLATGWRGAMVGGPIRRLVSGDAALAFDGRGGLVLEARSRRPLDAVTAPSG